jgi:hypothetical protein
MEELLNAAKTPKIAERDYSELLSGLAKVRWLYWASIETTYILMAIIF